MMGIMNAIFVLMIIIHLQVKMLVKFIAVIQKIHVVITVFVIQQMEVVFVIMMMKKDIGLEIDVINVKKIIMVQIVR